MDSLQRIILIADDNLDSAESLAILLGRDGHDVHTASDGLEAVEVAAKLRPDVILLDIGMPRLDGIQAARRIRAQENGKHAYIVALTGWGPDQHLGDLQAAGFDLHLLKPVDFDALEKILEKASARVPQPH